MTLKKPLRLAGALVLTALAAAMAAPPAQAADPFRPTVQGCVALAGIGCTTLTQFDGAWDVQVSPDGKYAYVSAYESNALHVFTRDAATGGLTWKDCYSNTATAPCKPANGIGNADEIQFSPDGKFMYVSGWAGNVAAFKVEADGLLAQLNCVSSNGTSNGAAVCLNARAMSFVGGIQLSPDGKYLYVGSVSADSIVVLRVEPNGSLSQPAGPAGCIANNPATEDCADGRGMAGTMRQISMSPDGTQLFAPADTRRGVLVFDRDAETGALTQPAGLTGCVTFDGNSGEPANPCAVNAAISGTPENVYSVGGQVYVTHGGGVVTLRREGGGLVHQSCINNTGASGCTDGRHAQNAGYAEVSPDGQHLVVSTLYSQDGLTFFSRDASGNLSTPDGPDTCLSPDGVATDAGGDQPNGCRSRQLATGHGRVDFVDDGRFYVANFHGDSVFNVYRDFYPQCQSKSVDVAHNVSKQVDLTCGDRNGEPIALEIVAAPVGGSLGGIDQDNDRVFYNPFAGFSGADKFTYRAKAGALFSEAATVNLNVAAPPVDNDKDGVSPPADCDDNNAAARPGATEVPGNAVDEDCLNGPQALPPGKIGSGVDYYFDARNPRFTKVGRLDVLNVIAGATVQVRCIGGKKKGCKFTSKKRTLSKAAAKYSVKRYFNFKKKKRKIVSRLKKGTKIEIRVTKAGMIGKVITFTTRRGKTPSFTVTCIPVGSTKPQKTC